MLARLVLIEAPLGSAHANEQLWAAAARLVPQHDPATHNQALMELGARLCTPADPQCPSCPVELHCAARRLGRAHELPRARPRKATQDLRLAGVILARADHIVLRRRPEQERLGGQWEIPATELVAAARSQDVVQQMLRGLGATIKGSAMHVGTVRHAILHYRIRLDVYHAPLRRWHAAADGATLLLGARQRAQLPITTLTRKAMRLLPALEGER
ncbi:MAG: NUDIX domain-containing protein [Planctomycetota bacterium]